jgi:hypothetical protein
MQVKRHLIERLCEEQRFYAVMNIDKRITDVDHRVVHDANPFMGLFFVFPGQVDEGWCTSSLPRPILFHVENVHGDNQMAA